MPRVARKKYPESIYHIIVRSIKEIDLFRDSEDKVKYLEIIKKYQVKYGFAVYAYCLMDNHGHFVIDCLGADISKIMHAINFSYAQYYNRKYDRYGHVFQDRFKSKIIDSKRYLITVSAYIHNNPKDIDRYKSNVQEYPFSSLNEYMHQTNKFGILTRSFLVSILGFSHKENRKAYMKLVGQSNNEEDIIDIEFINAETDYQSHRRIIAREFEPKEVIAYVANKLNQTPDNIYIKYRRGSTKIRSITCFLLSVFCNMAQKDICEVLGNITQSGVSNLTSKGLEIIFQEREILESFLTR